MVGFAEDTWTCRIQAPLWVEFESQSTRRKVSATGRRICCSNVSFTDAGHVSFDLNLTSAVTERGMWVDESDDQRRNISQGFMETELPTAGLVGYYSLNEGSGTVAHDTSVIDNDGTLISTPTGLV